MVEILFLVKVVLEDIDEQKLFTRNQIVYEGSNNRLAWTISKEQLFMSRKVVDEEGKRRDALM